MFKVTKFYNGQWIFWEANIDHGRVVQLVFGEMMPEMMRDSSCSFTVERLPKRV